MTAVPSSPLGPLIESPCVRVCEIDKSSGLCLGCKRTLQEIGGWSKMTEADRRRVMLEIETR